MESAALDFRPGLERPLRNDGGGGVAGLETRGFSAQRWPLALFLAQLALNALWTPLFFGLHRPGLAFLEIVLLWLAIAATLLAFRPVNLAAAWLLAPYLAWVSFAAALNFALWRLNP